MEEDFLHVPEDRIAVLIGKNGETKKLIEKQGNCRLKVDSETGEVRVEAQDAVQLMKAISVVKAIARGFVPGKALNLFDDDYCLEIIKLRELIGKSEKAIENKKARVIGKQGKVRERIEELAECFVSVYGNTIGIIGKLESISAAKEGIEMLLQGAKIENLERFLLKEKKGKEFEL